MSATSFRFARHNGYFHIESTQENACHMKKYILKKKEEISETLQPVENRKTDYFSTFFSNMYSYFLNANEPRGSSILHG